MTTDHADLCKRLRDIEYLHTNAVCPELRLESARAIEALEADNAALRQALRDENSLRLGYRFRNGTPIESTADALLAGKEGK